MTTQWEQKILSAKPSTPATQMQTPRGVLRIPAKPALPERHRFIATFAARSWPEIEEELVAFWEQICDVLPKYYGEGEPSPAWHRIVCIIDLVYGSITTNLWHRAEPPTASDRVTVIARVPWIKELNAESSNGGAGGPGATLVDPVRDALRGAAGREPAKSRLELLHGRHPFALFTMEPEDVDSLRPLTPDAHTS
jgi:hypothetical protein